MKTPTEDRQKGDPLPKGAHRRLTDARCAWRGMDDDQRAEFLAQILPGATGSRILERLRADGWRFK